MPDSHAPHRIACLQPSATVILASVGELGRVVACTKYCAEVVPELDVSNRLVIADSWSAKSSEILAAKPDLVIAAVPYQEAAVTEILKAGVRFLGLAPRTLDDIYTDIATIAGCAGSSERGARVISDMQAEIEDVRSRTASLPRKRVFCEEWGKPIIASQPWVAELVRAAGGEFVAVPGKTSTAEEIASAQPDVIVAAWCGAGDRVPLEKMVEQRGWADLPAVRQGRVFCINDELLNTPATNLLGGLRALAWALHPELFPRPAGIRQLHRL